MAIIGGIPHFQTYPFEQCSKPLLLDDYPLVNKQFANLNMAIEIVDVSIKNGGSFHSYVNVYQRV